MSDRLAHGAEPHALPLYLADLNGDGKVDAADLDVLLAAFRTRRGLQLEPSDGYDFRADLLARGRVGQPEVAVFEGMLGRANGSGSVQRPITVGWHYGWYNNLRRRGQTAGFLGGDYLSKDKVTEGAFNRLKNEFGVSVDALSWITPRHDRRIMRNYSKGYLKAEGVRTRHVALLYESGISLGAEGQRIDFTSTTTRGNMVEDFGLMGAFLTDRVARAGAPVFKLDGRPVIFLFASHSWIMNPRSEFEFRALEDTIEAAMERFANEYGEIPYLVGEEMPLAPDDEFGEDRFRRSQNFDGIFVYHHAASRANVLQAGNAHGAAYTRQQKKLLRRTLGATIELRNRFTGQPPLIIPSLAAGFAKDGEPTLAVSRSAYVDFMNEITSFMRTEYYESSSGRPLRLAPAPVYSVGSWNEEFEGHTLFPFLHNRSLPSTEFDGFDLALAVKQVFGWNHYATRPIEG